MADLDQAVDLVCVDAGGTLAVPEVHGAFLYVHPTCIALFQFSSTKKNLLQIYQHIIYKGMFLNNHPMHLLILLMKSSSEIVFVSACINQCSNLNSKEQLHNKNVTGVVN